MKGPLSRLHAHYKTTTNTKNSDIPNKDTEIKLIIFISVLYLYDVCLSTGFGLGEHRVRTSYLCQPHVQALSRPLWCIISFTRKIVFIKTTTPARSCMHFCTLVWIKMKLWIFKRFIEIYTDSLSSQFSRLMPWMGFLRHISSELAVANFCTEKKYLISCPKWAAQMTTVALTICLCVASQYIWLSVILRKTHTFTLIHMYFFISHYTTVANGVCKLIIRWANFNTLANEWKNRFWPIQIRKSAFSQKFSPNI